MNESDLWRDVVGYEGIYEVSSLGRVRSLDRIDAGGHRLTGRLLSPSVHSNGYMGLLLSKDAKIVTKKVHRLVLEAFRGPCPDGCQTRHLDGCQTNNELTNLCWGLPTENYDDQIRHGTRFLRAVRRSDGETFTSVKEAALSIGGHATLVTRCCKSIYKTTGGYGWDYI